VLIDAATPVLPHASFNNQYYGKGKAMSTAKVAKARLGSQWGDFALDNV
jgi:hypothetical protein